MKNILIIEKQAITFIRLVNLIFSTKKLFGPHSSIGRATDL